MKSKILLLVILTFTNIIHAKTDPIVIKFLPEQQTLNKLVELQANILMSENPKELSAKPEAICFEANIDEFLLQTTETKNIYGCVFSDQVAMNAALLRAGLFVHTDMGMASDAQLFSSKLMTAVGGHDFDGKELVKYYDQAQVPKESAAEHEQLKYIESEFYTKVIAKIIQQNKDKFIFFAIINTKNYKANLTHELLHAQYYNVPQIKPILEQEWQKVPQQDKDIIVTCLQNGGYDVRQQELLMREFYSYFVQYDAAEYLKTIQVLTNMSELANVYGPKIIAALKAAKIKPLLLN